jgi:hypothetical protein
MGLKELDKPLGQLDERPDAPPGVITAVEDVAATGAVNMFDKDKVLEICRRRGHTKAAAWIAGHDAEYAKGILRGFKGQA